MIEEGFTQSSRRARRAASGGSFLNPIILFVFFVVRESKSNNGLCALRGLCVKL